MKEGAFQSPTDSPSIPIVVKDFHLKPLSSFGDFVSYSTHADDAEGGPAYISAQSRLWKIIRFPELGKIVPCREKEYHNGLSEQYDKPGIK